MKRVVSAILAMIMLFSMFSTVANAGTHYVENTEVGRSGNTAIRWNYGIYTGWVVQGPYCLLPDGEGTLYFTNDIVDRIYSVGYEDYPDDGPYREGYFKAIKYVGSFSDGYSNGAGKRYYEGGYIMDGTFHGSYNDALNNNTHLWDGKFWINSHKYLVGYETATTSTTGQFHWDSACYEITYDANGGSGAPSSQWKERETNLTLSSTKPTREGYDFVGWSTDKNATSATYSAGGTYSANKEATLYAVWKIKTYSIYYNANGGTGAPATQTKTYGVDLVLSSDVLVREDYQFLGWSTSSTATTATYSAGSAFTDNKSVTLYAVWKKIKFHITYDANGGTGAPEKQKKDLDVDLTLSSVIPQREDYQFLGWSTSSTATTATYSAGSVYTENKTVTLYAVWKRIKFHITYDANGGTGAPEKQDKNLEENIYLSSTVPVREGYTFLGWAEKDAFKNGYDYLAVPVRLQYTMFDYYNSPLNQQLIERCIPLPSFVQPKNIQKEIKSDIKNTSVNALYQPGELLVEDKDLDLYAVWGGEYTITYDTNGGGSAPSPQIFSGNGAIAITCQIPEKDGFFFKGWSENQNATEATYQPGDAYTKSESVTLYAVWEAKENTFTITYNANGGVGAPPSQTKYAGETVYLSDVVPVRLGYKFAGWSTFITNDVIFYYNYNSHYFPITNTYYGGYFYPGSEYSYDTDVTFFAVWEQNNWSTTYSVETYMMDTQGEYELASVSEYEADFEVVAADFIVPFGFTLNTEKSVLTQFVKYNGDPPVLKVYLDRNIHSVSFDDGTETTVNELYFGATIVKPADPEKEGYTFLGWSLDGETVVDVPETVPDEDVSYVAVWEKNQYTITYKLDGEEYFAEPYQGAADSVYFDDTVTVREKPVLTCRTITDWEFTPELVDGKMPAQDVVANATSTESHTPGEKSVENTVEPTCTENGSFDEVVYCTVCGEELERETVETDALGHDYDSVVTDPKCTEGGYTSHTCSRCGDNYTDSPVPALGHDWGEWEITSAPTCVTAGEETRICSRDDSHVETREISVDPDNHDYQFVKTVVPTCTQEGYDVYTCSRCKATENRNITEALGHDYVAVVTAPGCTQAGYTTYTCSRCGDKYVDDVLTANGHSWDEGKITTAPECTKDGVKTYTCIVCGITRTESVASLNHDYHSVVSVPTCTEPGETKHICSRCGDTFTDTPVAALGHDWGEWFVVKEATIDEKGQEKRVCKRNRDHVEYRDTQQLKSYTATFVVINDDGTKTVVDTVRFAEGKTVITEPAVPEKDSRYIGYWEQYTLSDRDIEIKAVYELKSSENESEMETKKEVVYSEGTATVTLSAFAQTLNAKVKYGAKPVDVILVLDTSYSMVSNNMPNGKTRLDVLKEVSNGFVDTVAENAEANDVDHKIAIVSFDTSAKRLTGTSNATAFVSSSDADLASKINSLSTGMGTRSDYGMDAAKAILEATQNDGREKFVIFLTDGVPSNNGTTFNDSYANSAIATANSIKNDYATSIYSIGVSVDATPDTVISANPSTTNEKMNAFMHYISSNYPYSSSMSKGGNAEDNSYFITADDVDTLKTVFNNIIAQQISNTITFLNITLEDTVSKYFTLTTVQEEALRANLAEQYGVTQEQISIVRNADETTTIRIENVSPRPIYQNSTQIGYGVTVSFEVSANEKAIDAGFYSVTTGDNASIEKDGVTVALFDVPDDIEIDDARYIVKYIVDDEIYAIEETRPGQIITPPQFEDAVFVVGNNSVVTDRVTVITTENGPIITTDTQNVMIENGQIFGLTNVTSEEDILSAFSVKGDATVSVEPTEYGYGTGTQVNVVKDGEIVETYTVIVSGDATGDAVIDESDFVMIDLFNSMLYMPGEDDPIFKGMDCNKDGIVDESDMVLVDLVNAFMGEIDPINGGIIFY